MINSPTIPKHLLLDNVRLIQVLMNFVGNAIKFTNQGNICIETEWKMEESKSYEQGRTD